jgi:hypothetical protein
LEAGRRPIRNNMLPAGRNDVRTSVRCRRLKCWLPQGKESGEHQIEQTWALLQCPIPRKCPPLKAELCLLAGCNSPQVGQNSTPGAESERQSGGRTPSIQQYPHDACRPCPNPSSQ